MICCAHCGATRSAVNFLAGVAGIATNDPVCCDPTDERRSWREWAEGRRHTGSAAIEATCMVCGGWKACLRVNDIGWMCLDCYHRPEEPSPGGKEQSSDQHCAKR